MEDPKRLVLYLSGGLAGHNLKERKAEFKKYQEKYEGNGLIVYNPLDLDGGQHGSLDGEGILRPTESEWREFMARDIAIILTGGVDRLYMLPGWTHSKGARLEVLNAAFVGIPIYNARTGAVIDNAKKKAKDADAKR